MLKVRSGRYFADLIAVGIYLSFSSFTRRSLSHALAESGVTLKEDQTEEMMKAYDSLATFPDVQPMLEKLRSTKEIKRVIFSNGTHDMVSSSVKNSPDLGPHSDIFDDIVSVSCLINSAVDHYLLFASKLR